MHDASVFSATKLHWHVVVSCDSKMGGEPIENLGTSYNIEFSENIQEKGAIYIQSALKFSGRGAPGNIRGETKEIYGEIRVPSANRVRHHCLPSL